VHGLRRKRLRHGACREARIGAAPGSTRRRL